MLKEIIEQPQSITQALRGRLLTDQGTARLDGLNLTGDAAQALQRIVLLGCGTSWHAGLAGRYILERLAGIPVQVEYASEFRHQTRLPLTDALVVAISQSGETADTLEALRAARSAGARCVGLVNTVGSTIARESDGGVYLHAGPEIGVASTKAFTCQLTALLLLGLVCPPGLRVSTRPVQTHEEAEHGAQEQQTGLHRILTDYMGKSERGRR